jgi:four helix bundle protein
VTEDWKQTTVDGRQKAAESGSPQSSPTGLQSPVTGPATYKFQSLQVYQLALDYLDKVYDLAHHLPDVEKFNLRSQLERAATSVVLNIAEGSTGQSDPEQSRFNSMALRSYLETVACLDIAERRGYLASSELKPLRASGHQLFVKLLALRKALSRPSSVPSPRSS